jgi:hypothetical protein
MLHVYELTAQRAASRKQLLGDIDFRSYRRAVSEFVMLIRYVDENLRHLLARLLNYRWGLEIFSFGSFYRKSFDRKSNSPILIFIRR